MMALRAFVAKAIASQAGLLAQKGTTTAFPSGLTIAAPVGRRCCTVVGETMGEEFRDKGSNVQLGPDSVSRACPRMTNYTWCEDPYRR